MSKLSDFKPLRRVLLPGLGELRSSGLIVVVGPNSSGKTQLLRDLREKVSGEPRDLVVADEIEVETPDQEEFLKALKAEGYILSVYSPDDEEQFVPRTAATGTGQAAPNVNTNQLEQWRTQSQTPGRGKRRPTAASLTSRTSVKPSGGCPNTLDRVVSRR